MQNLEEVLRNHLPSYIQVIIGEMSDEEFYELRTVEVNEPLKIYRVLYSRYGDAPHLGGSKNTLIDKTYQISQSAEESPYKKVSGVMGIIDDMIQSLNLYRYTVIGKEEAKTEPDIIYASTKPTDLTTISALANCHSSSSFINQWDTPQLIKTIVLPDAIELIYKQQAKITLLVDYGNNTPIKPLERVYMVRYSCVNGKWHETEPMFGKIIPAQHIEEQYEF